MTKKEELVWRLGKLPTVEEITTLIDKKIITQEEARQILFNKKETEERDKTSLEAEIKFLRELVERISVDKSQVIRFIQEPSRSNINVYPFYEPYIKWTYTNGTSSFNTIQTW